MFLFYVPIIHGEPDLLIIQGTVKDTSSKKGIENVNVTVENTSKGTVTNADGKFILKIPRNLINHQITFSRINYTTNFIKVKDESTPVLIYMSMIPKEIREVTAKPVDAENIVRTAISLIGDNYPNYPSLLSGFYRETIKKKNRYISISEAVENVYKPSYTGNGDGEKLQILKGRKLISPKLSDTLSVKLIGGPLLVTSLDYVMKKWPFFEPENINWYHYEFDGYEVIDGNINYKIKFTPAISQIFAMYQGLFYIDRDTHAFTRMELSTDMSDEYKVTNQILRKKPTGMRFKPKELSYLVTYKTINGLAYINYIKGVIRFQCDWKKRLFHTNYTVTAEAVITDHIDNPSIGISRKDAFRDNYVLPDKLEYFNDTDFWKNYNILEPTVSLEDAVNKIKKSHKDLDQ